MMQKLRKEKFENVCCRGCRRGNWLIWWMCRRCLLLLRRVIMRYVFRFRLLNDLLFFCQGNVSMGSPLLLFLGKETSETNFYRFQQEKFRLPTYSKLLIADDLQYYDRCTIKFLEQAGVNVEWLRLEDVGIRGNGHMFFLEKNSEEIAEVLERWLSRILMGSQNCRYLR